LISLLISACAGKPQEEQEEEEENYVNRLWTGGEIYVQGIISAQLIKTVEDLHTDSPH
jgi:preprotein translocase subunit YajC